jgi:hypothetical protein
MNVYSSGPPGPGLSCNLELQRLEPMKSIRSVPPIIRNIISGRVKDASIVIAAIELFNTLQLTFVCQLMLHELASRLLSLGDRLRRRR